MTREQTPEFIDRTPKFDIFGSLVLNLDQAKFKKIVDKCAAELTQFSTNVFMGNKRTSGYTYQDFVVTINVSRDRGSLFVYRNRTSKLVYAMIDNKVASINYEYIFIEEHLTKLLKEFNG